MEPKIKLFRVIYNHSSGNYSFDDEFFSVLFMKTYEEKYGNSKSDTRYYFDNRRNPRILEIYDELGEKNSSKRDEEAYSSLQITYFPEELVDYLKVITMDGGEQIGVDSMKFYMDFYDRVIKQNESVETVKPQFQRWEYVMDQYLKESWKPKRSFENSEIFIK